MINLQRENIQVENVKNLTYYGREEIHKLPKIAGTAITHSRVTGVGRDEHQILVYVEEETNSVINQLPSDINGIPVLYKKAGKITNSIGTFDGTFRPVRPGCNIGPGGGSGTLGGFAVENTTGKIVGITNRHVIAACSPNCVQGGHISNPGYSMFGEPFTIGYLHNWALFDYSMSSNGWGTTNYADTACFTLSQRIDTNTLCNYPIGPSVTEYVGMIVNKVGWMTGCTQGTIIAINWNTVQFGPITGASGRMLDQMEININQQSGDSGALAFENGTNKVVGIAWAQIDYGTYVTAGVSASRYIESILGVTFGNITDTTETHFECIDGKCILVIGPGPDKCMASIPDGICNPPCVPNWICNNPLNGYEHDINNCGWPDRLNSACSQNGCSSCIRT